MHRNWINFTVFSLYYAKIESESVLYPMPESIRHDFAIIFQMIEWKTESKQILHQSLVLLFERSLLDLEMHIQEIKQDRSFINCLI